MAAAVVDEDLAGRNAIGRRAVEAIEHGVSASVDRRDSRADRSGRRDEAGREGRGLEGDSIHARLDEQSFAIGGFPEQLSGQPVEEAVEEEDRAGPDDR
jgi:hypothetical protein